MNSLFKKSLILYYFLRVRHQQFKNRESLRVWQQHSLMQFKQTILINSPFYRDYANKSFAELPIINKSIHMKNFNEINTRNIKLDNALEVASQAEKTRNFSTKLVGISVGLSSGTSGNRGVFLTSEQEQSMWAGTIIAKMLPRTMMRHRIALFLRADNNLYQTINSKFLHFEFFDLMLPWETLLEKCHQYRPTLLVAPAKVLTLLADEQGAKIDINPSKIISIAEVLVDDEKIYIENQFHQTVHQIYQCTEGFLACTCEQGSLHLNEDIVYFEKVWLDKNSGRFSPIITDYRRHTQPIVRYKLDDILIDENHHCACGSALATIKKIEGRWDDILYLPQGNTLIKIFPDFVVRALLSSSATIHHFQVNQINEQQLLICLDSDEPAIQQRVAENLNNLWDSFSVQKPIYHFQTIPKMSLYQKKRRVIRTFSPEDH